MKKILTFLTKRMGDDPDGPPRWTFYLMVITFIIFICLS